MCRIGILVDNFSQGGLQKSGFFLANSFAERGYKVFFYALTYSEPVWRLDKSIKITGLNFRPSPYVLGKLKACFESTKKLKKELIKDKIEFLIILGDMTLLVGFCARTRNIKIIGSERNAPSRYNFLWKNIMSFLFSNCYKVVFQTNGAMDFFGSKVKAKSVVIPNPYFELSDSYTRGTVKNYISTAAARFEYKKGIDVLIKAFALISNEYPLLRLKIIGDGYLKEEYIELADSLGILERIVFTGKVKNVVNEVIDTKLFVLPSRIEGIPNVLMEVMGAGIPVLASDCPPGGPRLLTDNGRYGVLFKTDSDTDLANKMRWCLEHYDSFSSNEEKEYIIKSFDKNRIFEMWEELIIYTRTLNI